MAMLTLLSVFLGILYGCNGCPSVEDCVTISPETFNCSGYTTDDLDDWESKYELIVSAGSIIFPQAAHNLQHFLDGSGDLLQMPKEFLLGYSAVTDRIEANKQTIICGTSTAGTGIIGRGRDLMEGDSKKEKICYCTSTYSTFFTDLYYASGGFTIHTSTETCLTRKGDVLSFTMSDITHTFYDPYDWEAAAGLGAYVPFFRNVPDAAAYCLEANNRGKSFIMKTTWKDDDSTISGTINLNSIDCKYKRDDSIDACKSPPWLFVVDTTGSMGNDVVAVKHVVNHLITKRKDTKDEPRLYVLSEFNDPSIGPVTIDVDADPFLGVVNALGVSGGGDCPEYAMSGILNAIPHADENSYMFFFTDASAKDYRKQGSVFAALRKTKTSFVAFISGSCGRRRRLLDSGNTLYSRLAFESGGFPIFTTHSGVDDVIPIVESLTLKNTVLLYNIVKEFPLATDVIHVDIPIDSNLKVITFIVASNNVSPYMDITSYPSDSNITETITLSADSLYSMYITPNNIEAYGHYTIQIRTTCCRSADFVSLTIISQTLLAFNFYFSTDLHTTGVDSGLFEGVLKSQSLRVTVFPLDSLYVNTIDAISIVSIDGENIVSNNNISIDTGGYYTLFTTDDYDVVGDSFHILVTGRDINNNEYFRMMNTPISLQKIRLNIMNAGATISIGTNADISFELSVVDNTTQHVIQLSATSNLGSSVTLSVTPGSVSTSDSALAILSIYVHDVIELIGEDLSVTLTAIDSLTGDHAYKLIDFVVISTINDTTAPQCISINNTFDTDCVAFDSCNSSFWYSMVYVFDTNNENNYGISWITTINDDPYSLTTIHNNDAFESGDYQVYLSFKSSCCNTYSEFIVGDVINQISSCELNVADKCPYDEIFGEANLNETVTVQCMDIANNTGLNGGELSRTCMMNGKWFETIFGKCYLTETPCPNPCISGNTAPQDLYHPHCRSCCRFIQCDAFGNAFDMPCSVGTYWDQALLTCDHNINQCTDAGCSQSPAAAHINPFVKSVNPLTQNKNVNVEHKYYYGYITVIGVIAFILLNNVFLGCWCLGKGRDKAHAKFDMVSVNDEI